jgi:hypothetical protein
MSKRSVLLALAALTLGGLAISSRVEGQRAPAGDAALPDAIAQAQAPYSHHHRPPCSPLGLSSSLFAAA